MPNVVLNRDSGDTWCRLLSSANIQNLLSSANIQNLFSSAKLALLTYRSFSASLTYRSFSTVLTHRLHLSSADLQMYRTQGYPFWRECRVYLLWPVFLCAELCWFFWSVYIFILTSRVACCWVAGAVWLECTWPLLVPSVSSPALLPSIPR